MSKVQFPALAACQSLEMGCQWLMNVKLVCSLLAWASQKICAVRVAPWHGRFFACTPTDTIYYYYDGLGRRIAKRKVSLNEKNNAKDSNQTIDNSITWFAWDGDQLALEENQSHQTHYLYEPGSFIPLAQAHLVKDYIDPFQEKTETGLLGKLFGTSKKESKSESANDAAQTQQVANGAPQAFYTSNHERITPKHYPNGKTFILHYQVDQLGTPQLLHDDEGNIHWLAYYQQAWGEIKPALSGLSKYAKMKNPLRFQGQYFDEETGLHYNRHRYYDPHSGRFISQDPIGLAGGLNSYAYAPNPTGWIDPLGLRHTTRGRDKNRREANNKASAYLAKFDEDNNSHTYSRHGMNTTREQQQTRALTGITPDNPCPIRKPAIRSGTRFLNSIDHKQALERGKKILEEKNSAKETFDMGRIIGEGYRENSHCLEKTSKVTVRRNKQGQIYTAYPQLPEIPK